MLVTNLEKSQDCANQLKAKTFGSFDEMWGDNVVCREVHVLLTRSRPDVSDSISYLWWFFFFFVCFLVLRSRHIVLKSVLIQGLSFRFIVHMSAPLVAENVLI